MWRGKETDLPARLLSGVAESKVYQRVSFYLATESVFCSNLVALSDQSVVYEFSDVLRGSTCCNVLLGF